MYVKNRNAADEGPYAQAALEALSLYLKEGVFRFSSPLTREFVVYEVWSTRYVVTRKDPHFVRVVRSSAGDWVPVSPPESAELVLSSLSGTAPVALVTTFLKQAMKSIEEKAPSRAVLAGNTLRAALATLTT